MGLSLVKRFVEALGGNIFLKSEVNKGSIFTISLPDKKIEEQHNEKETINLMDNRLIQTIDIEFSDIYF